MLYKRIILLLMITFTTLLAGCNDRVYKQTQSNVATAIDEDRAAQNRMADKLKPSPALVVNQGLYVDKTPISLAKDPEWLKSRVVLRGEQLPFSYYTRTVVGGGSRTILTHYQSGLDQDVKMSINYAGTVKGALELLAAKTGYVYSVNGNDVYWQAFITKTFDIAFMPGGSDYLMGTGGGGGGSSGGNATAATAGGVGGTNQYSNFKGTISVWKDLADSLQQLLSADGKVMVSQATTSVTVRDRPANVKLVSRFISNLNANLSRQVLVKIDVIEITLENDFNFGINWNLVQRAMSNGTYQLISNNGSPISISSVTGLTGNFATLGINNAAMLASTGGRTTGVITLLNSLKQQGKVSILTQPQVLCQNNQVSEVRLTDDQVYLASVQTTSLAGGSTAGSAAITSQITPGDVQTGFVLYVLPKIMGQKVYLQVDADISNNLGLSVITSNGATLSTSAPPPAGTSIIQAPHTQQKHFNQRSVIASGDTLILAGFKQVGNITGAQQLLDSQALGGKTSQQTNTETLVLITPYILHGLA